MTVLRKLKTVKIIKTVAVIQTFLQCGLIKKVLQWVSFFEFIYFLDEKKITDNIFNIVKDTFPNKHITPIAFRRIIPSLIFAQELHKEGQTKEDFVNDLATALNTSSKVFKPFLFI